MNISTHAVKALTRSFAGHPNGARAGSELRRRVGPGFTVRPTFEQLFASEEAAAIERMLDDAADVAGSDAAQADCALREALVEAFTNGHERAWRRVYEILDVLVADVGSGATPARTRLASFLAENADLRNARA